MIHLVLRRFDGILQVVVHDTHAPHLNSRLAGQCAERRRVSLTAVRELGGAAGWRVRVRRCAPACDGRVHLGVDRVRPGGGDGSGCRRGGGCLTVRGCRALTLWAPGVGDSSERSTGASVSDFDAP